MQEKRGWGPAGSRGGHQPGAACQGRCTVAEDPRPGDSRGSLWLLAPELDRATTQAFLRTGRGGHRTGWVRAGGVGHCAALPNNSCRVLRRVLHAGAGRGGGERRQPRVNRGTACPLAAPSLAQISARRVQFSSSQTERLCQFSSFSLPLILLCS